jgi:hypothetical protein
VLSWQHWKEKHTAKIIKVHASKQRRGFLAFFFVVGKVLAVDAKKLRFSKAKFLLENYLKFNNEKSRSNSKFTEFRGNPIKKLLINIKTDKKTNITRPVFNQKLHFCCFN